MTAESDSLLLRRYADKRDEAAFAELVRRRLDGVYSNALRRVGGDTHLAEEVAQHVFVALSRQTARLASHPDLVGWLHLTTRHHAANAVRAERRRKAREQKAYAMSDDSAAPEIDWKRVAPVLDDSIAQLAPPDRAVILLRFVERRAFAEIGDYLNVSADAARMRVDRAVEKLKRGLERRGIASTAAALGLALGTNAAATAPANLAVTITGAALGAGAGSGALAALTSFIAMSKLKIGIAAAAAVMITGLALREVQAGRALDGEIRRLEAMPNETAAAQAANQRLIAALSAAPPDDSAAKELAELRRRIGVLNARPEGVLDSEMKPVSAYANRGWATPRSAYETQVWARATGNVDAFLPAYGWTPSAKAKIDRFFAALPESVRAKFGTPERMIAPGKDSGPMGELEAVQILGETRYGDSVRVHAWGRFSSGREIPLDMLFQNLGGEWRIPITDVQAERWIKEYDPTTGERYPTK